MGTVKGYPSRPQPLNDPQQLASEHNYLSSVRRVGRHVPMALWILVKCDCSSKEIRHSLLFGDR